MRSFSFYPKGKKKQHPQGHKNKQGRQEDKPRTTKAKQAKSIKEEQTQGQKKKNKGKHATSL